jgi:hypothetical protein
LELWRTNLRALGIKLAVISVCSFACKAVLVALAFFGVLSEGSSLDLSMSTLLVEALPSLLTIALLIRYHSGSIRAARGSDIGVSLLTRKASTRDHTAIDAALVQESRDNGLKQANFDQKNDNEAWLAQFMANGLTIGAAARTPRGNESIAEQEGCH